MCVYTMFGTCYNANIYEYIINNVSMQTTRLSYFTQTLFFLLLAFFASASSAFAATSIEVAIDASGSMNAKIGNESRMDIAKRVVTETFKDLDVDMALRAFGHNYGNTEADKSKSCTDTELLVNFGNEYSVVTAAVSKLKPSGWTPLAYTIAKAGEDVKKKEEKTALIILSDGVDSCGGNAEAEVQKLIAAGVDVTVHVVGFAVDATAEASLKRIALAGGGKYFTANNADELVASFEEIVELEEVSAKGAADVINTKGAEHKIVGGSTFDDAKQFPTELYGQEVSLNEHLLPGAFETFKIDVEAGQRLKINILTGEKGVAKNKAGVVEVSEKYNPWSMIKFYTDRKVEIDSVRTYAKPFTELDDTVAFDKSGTVYFFIGADEKVSNYGMPSDTIYTFTLIDKDGNPIGGADGVIDSGSGDADTDAETRGPGVENSASGNEAGETFFAKAMALIKSLGIYGIGAVLILVVFFFGLLALRKR